MRVNPVHVGFSGPRAGSALDRISTRHGDPHALSHDKSRSVPHTAGGPGSPGGSGRSDATSSWWFAVRTGGPVAWPHGHRDEKVVVQHDTATSGERITLPAPGSATHPAAGRTKRPLPRLHNRTPRTDGVAGPPSGPSSRSGDSAIRSAPRGTATPSVKGFGTLHDPAPPPLLGWRPGVTGPRRPGDGRPVAPARPDGVRPVGPSQVRISARSACSRGERLTVPRETRGGGARTGSST